ncbi:MAG TPA: Mpo1-like protein [Vicinamibacteria bacterium]
MSSTLRSHFDDYAAFHRTAGNKACHMLGIPIIVLSSLAMLGQVPLFPVFGFTVTAAEFAIVVFSAYYLTLDLWLGALMLAAYVALDVVGRAIPPWPALGLFVGGWILQGVGHYVYEKNSPAFFRNFLHLAVGQLWILAKATRRA